MWAADWKDTSYWLEGLSPVEGVTDEIAAKTDVLVIGSGFTGINAAIEMVRGGREVMVIEAGTPGFGCSTRNGGQVSTSIKPSQEKLAQKHGAKRASAIRQEGQNALDWIEERIKGEEIDCSFARCGRFHAAHSPAHYERLARDAEHLSRTENIPYVIVPKAEQHKELGTDMYHGGVIFTRHSRVDPARYHHGLLARAIESGAKVVQRCTAQAIERSSSGFEVKTSKGVISCRDLVVATNGYTSDLTPWLQRRVIPIGSYIIATEPIDPEVMDVLFPTNRIVSDTCKVIYYYRPSPDRKRILFGGRVSGGETNPAQSGPKLHRDLTRIFPQLKQIKITHSWFGTVAYTFDELAHTGNYDGIYYSMGYCGSGVSMASYLGMRLGQKVLGLAEGKTAFDDLPFETRPLYRGKPWFLPAVVSWYRWRDQWQIAQAQKAALGKSSVA